MIGRWYIFFLLISLSSFTDDSFKDEQLRYARVRQAYADKGLGMQELLAEKKLETDQLRLYLRAFKKEKKIELWGKKSSDSFYQHIKTYRVCQTSGGSGPKRQQGDLQIPEGFYHINLFNPHSHFYLSLGINYPNRSDQILGVRNNLGGEIFIHGACVTIGCLPITDPGIKELYIFCVEAKNNGQTKIPVTIFPSELTETEFSRLSMRNQSDSDKMGLWTDLKKGYNIFNEKKQLPIIEFLPSGRHAVTEAVYP
ncbi:MAG: hypothetical protein ABFS38_20400 [Bacteroidota bacterium]